MTYITTITQKGQVTIPVEIRKYLGLKPREKVTFTRIDEKIVIAPAEDFMRLKGSIKSQKKYSDDQADKKVRSYVKKQYEKK